MSLIPGLRFKLQGRPAEASPLHTDVAGFIGRTRRGSLWGKTPSGDPLKPEASRVEGWRRFVRDFGGLDEDMSLTYALRGYFANGGQVAYVVRVNGHDDQFARSDVWVVPTDPPTRYRFAASSPGVWGNTITVSVRIRSVTGSRSFVTAGLGRAAPVANALLPRKLVIDLSVVANNEPTEYILGLDPMITDQDEQAGLGTTIVHRVEQESYLIRLVPVDSWEPKTKDSGNIRGLPTIFPLKLDQSGTSDPSLTEYLNAVQLLGDQPEVSMLAVPSIHEDLSDNSLRWPVIRALIDQASSLYDREVIVDPPPEITDAIGFERFVDDLRALVASDNEWKSATVYGPWLRVPDLLGGAAKPLRRVPPSGHVAGVISRLDRERGAHYTPANVPMLDAVDLDTTFPVGDDGRIAAAGVNLVICRPGRGLMVWGGRTLDPRPSSMYLAHRRLVHRLVRTFRRVAEPIVFEPNGPQLRLALTRALNSVLLDAFRVGALVGDRPEEGFRVQCDDETNPPDRVDQGFAICKVSVAPAVPMEFITFRVSTSETKQLEVFDT